MVRIPQAYRPLSVQVAKGWSPPASYYPERVTEVHHQVQRGHKQHLQAWVKHGTITIPHVIDVGVQRRRGDMDGDSQMGYLVERCRQRQFRPKTRARILSYQAGPGPILHFHTGRGSQKQAINLVTIQKSGPYRTLGRSPVVLPSIVVVRTIPLTQCSRCPNPLPPSAKGCRAHPARDLEVSPILSPTLLQRGAGISLLGVRGCPPILYPPPRKGVQGSPCWGLGGCPPNTFPFSNKNGGLVVCQT
jgi:hypothetical protein